MDALPSEIIEQIALTLKDEESQTLRTFSRVSSRVYKLVAPFLYSTVSIRFVGLSDLQDTVADFAETGLGRPFLTYATRLDIVALPGRERVIEGSARYRWGSPDRSVTIEDYMPYSVGSFMERFMSHFDLPGYGLRWGEYPGNYPEKEWRPLVSLVSRLKRLRSMHYAVTNAFPRALLDAVHQHHPTCQVHIWSPQTPSLDIPGVGPINRTITLTLSVYVAVDQLDMEVLRSPCLRAIKLDYPISDGYPKTSGLGKIIPFILRAPHLKHIHLHLNTAWGRAFENAIQSIPERTDLSTPVGLQSFSLQSYFLEDMALSQWAQATVLSTIKSLYLPIINCPSYLSRAAMGLESLERLWIGVDSGRHGWDTLSLELRCIFRQLRPLKYLCIQGLEDISLLHEVLERHGPSLIGLMLAPEHRRFPSPPQPQYEGVIYPYVDHTHLERIARSCPNLEDLRAPIRRSKGDNAEVRTYRALGTFPRLRNLILDLYGNPRPVLSAEGGIYTNESVGLDFPTPHVSLEDAFINFASDEALATAIWTEIYTHQPSRKLIRLRVSPWGYGAYEGGELYVILHLARSFLITHGGTNVVEIGREEKEAEWEVIAEPDEFEEMPPFQVSRSTTQLLHSIWPPTPSEPDWTTSWRSFPLQTDVDLS